VITVPVYLSPNVLWRSTSSCTTACSATLFLMAETTQSLDQRLEEIGAKLAWVRDYL